jgi:hypothetical protein
LFALHSADRRYLDSLSWLPACPHELAEEEAEDPLEDDPDYEPIEDDVSPLIEEESIDLSKKEELAKWDGLHEAIQLSHRPRWHRLLQSSRLPLLWWRMCGQHHRPSSTLVK